MLLVHCRNCKGLFDPPPNEYLCQVQCPFCKGKKWYPENEDESDEEEEPYDEEEDEEPDDEDEPDDEEEEEEEPDGWSLEYWRKWGLMKQSEKDACENMSKEEWQQRNWKQCPVCEEVLINIESGMCEECYQKFT